MSFFGSLFSAIIPALFGAGGNQQGSPAAGVNSTMGAMQPAPMQESPVGGTMFGTALREKTNEAFMKGISSVVGMPFTNLIAGGAGRANRKFLDQSFPELNPWEKAGITGSHGVGLQGQDVQERMQSKELSTRERIVDKQLEMTDKQIKAGILMNERSAGATEAASAISAGPVMAQVAALNDLHRARTFEAERRGELTSAQEFQSWFKNISSVLMRSSMYPADDKFEPKALGALAAQTFARGVGSVVGTGAKTKAIKKAAGKGKGAAPVLIGPQ